MSAFGIADILAWTGGRLANERELGERGLRVQVRRPVPLSGAGPDELAFYFSKSYEGELAEARPGILITGENFLKGLSERSLWTETAVVSCPDPYLALGILSEKFAAVLSSVAHPAGGRRAKDVHSTAAVHPEAQLGEDVGIGPNCVVERGARIGARTLLYPGCYVGPEVEIGEDSVLFPGVCLYEWTRIGKRARIHAGTVIGSDGFGYAPRCAGGRPVGFQKIYHLGRVVIGDDVEIGANCTLDRSTFGETRIDSGVKLDNQVHVGHNARIGENTVIAGGTCLAGRAEIGRFVMVGGLTGITNDVRIGDGASVGALALITKDVGSGEKVVGNPQREYSEHFRVHALLNRLLTEKRKGEKK